MDTVLALLDRLIPKKLKTREMGIYTSILVIVIALLSAGAWGYTSFILSPNIEKIEAERKAYQDSVAREQKYKEGFLGQKLDGINNKIDEVNKKLDKLDERSWRSRGR